MQKMKKINDSLLLLKRIAFGLSTFGIKGTCLYGLKKEFAEKLQINTAPEARPVA